MKLTRKQYSLKITNNTDNLLGMKHHYAHKLIG